MISSGSIKTEEYNCKIHGNFSGIPFSSIYLGKKRTLRPPCPECATEFNKETKIQNDNLAEQKFMKDVLSANIPFRFCRLSFRDFDINVSDTASHVLNVIKTYYNKFYRMKKYGTSLTLLGFPGTGKTHLSCTLLNRLLFEKKNVYYTTAFEILSAIKATYKKSAKISEISIINKLSRYDLLVIDEIGAHVNTQKDLSILFDIIDRRYRNNLPIILVSNLVENRFKDYIGERAFDRLKESNGVFLAFNWESYRK